MEGCGTREHNRIHTGGKSHLAANYGCTNAWELNFSNAVTHSRAEEASGSKLSGLRLLVGYRLSLASRSFIHHRTSEEYSRQPLVFSTPPDDPQWRYTFFPFSMSQFVGRGNLDFLYVRPLGPLNVTGPFRVRSPLLSAPGIS